MGKKEEYKEKNLRFLEEVATGEGVVKLPCGVLYKEIEKGTGVVSPELTDVVSVHYRGTLANGREFDNLPDGLYSRKGTGYKPHSSERSWY